jgi:hypothetical protein
VVRRRGFVGSMAVHKPYAMAVKGIIISREVVRRRGFVGSMAVHKPYAMAVNKTLQFGIR